MKKSSGWLRHIIITVLAFMATGMFAVLALNLSFLSPIAQVVKDFEMTDVYYQILHDTDEAEVDEDVTIVDMSALYSRRELASALRDIEAQQPKVVGVDLVFIVGMVLAMSITLSTLRLIPPCKAMMHCNSL